MSLNNYRISELLSKSIREEITPAEQQELDAALDQTPELRELQHRLNDNDWLAGELAIFDSINLDEEWSKLQQKATGTQAPVVPLTNKKRKIYIGAAAVGLLVLAALGWLLVRQPRQQTIANVLPVPATTDTVIVPGTEKAELTLADGRIIALNGQDHLQLTQQGSTRILDSNKQLKYSANETGTPVEPPVTLYNTVRTRAGQYKITLPDGTKVWLNAASSLHFPTAFTGTERKVELNGEAYFEVAHLTGKKNKTAIPFIVVTPKNVAIEVKGTRFNVMTYADEPVMNTTLLQGAVVVSLPAQTGSTEEPKMIRPTPLKPGQQVLIDSSLNIVEVKQLATPGEVIAWKDGFFQFEKAPVDQLLRQISRWYDINIEYKGAVPRQSFSGKIARNASINSVLTILKANGLSATLQGRKLIIP